MDKLQVDLGKNYCDSKGHKFYVQARRSNFNASSTAYQWRLGQCFQPYNGGHRVSGWDFLLYCGANFSIAWQMMEKVAGETGIVFVKQGFQALGCLRSDQ